MDASRQVIRGSASFDSRLMIHRYHSDTGRTSTSWILWTKATSRATEAPSPYSSVLVPVVLRTVAASSPKDLDAL